MDLILMIIKNVQTMAKTEIVSYLLLKNRRNILIIYIKSKKMGFQN